MSGYKRGCHKLHSICDLLSNRSQHLSWSWVLPALLWPPPSFNCCWLLLGDTGLHLCRGTMSLLLLSGPSWQQAADMLSPNLSGKRAEDKSDYFSLTYLFLKLDVSFFFFLCCGRLVFLGFPNLIIHSVLFLTATAVRNTLKIVNLGTSWKYQDEWKKSEITFVDGKMNLEIA